MSHRVRKSERLTKEEQKALNRFIFSQPTKTDAAYEIGVSRQVLDNVALKGSGSPETIATIRKKMKGLAAA